MYRRFLVPVVLALSATALCLVPEAAFAHAERTSSTPEEGSRLRRIPTTLTVNFSEPPTSGASVTVLDGCGRDIVSGIDVNGQTIDASLAEGAPGQWTVQTSVVSAVDGHNTRDSWSFRVSGRAECSSVPPPGGAAPSPPTSPGGSIPVVPLVVAGIAVVGMALIVRGRGRA